MASTPGMCVRVIAHRSRLDSSATVRDHIRRLRGQHRPEECHQPRRYHHLELWVPVLWSVCSQYRSYQIDQTILDHRRTTDRYDRSSIAPDGSGSTELRVASILPRREAVPC